MPQSKKRQHHHPQHHVPPHQSAAKKSNRAIVAAIVFFALIGLGIGFFAGDGTVAWLLGGAVIGAVCGYFFGRQIEKTFSNK